MGQTGIKLWQKKLKQAVGSGKKGDRGNRGLRGCKAFEKMQICMPM